MQSVFNNFVSRCLITILCLSFGHAFINAQNLIIKRSSNCEPISDLISTIEDTTTVHLSWTTPEGATSYSIFRDNDSLTTQTDSLFSEENVTFGSHYYCITANYDTCFSDPTCKSVVVSPTICNPPENLEATVDEEHYAQPVIILRWESAANTNMQSYNIYLDEILLAVGVTDTFFIVNGGIPGVETCFNVASLCDYFESEWSNTACATIPSDDECIPPSLFIAALSYANLQINLAWITEFYANSYNIYRNNAFLVNVMNDSYVDTDIEFGETYCYTITSVCSIGESNPTDQECIENVSLEEYTKTFDLFPNPASDLLNLETEASINEVQIFNIIGQLIYNKSNPDSKTVISVSDWESGVYLIKITTDVTTITKKVVVR